MGVGWLDEAGEPRVLALPFDQGVRGKFPSSQMDLFAEEDPNLGRAEWEQLMDWLEGRELIAHGAKYDLAMLEAGTREWAGRRLLNQLHWDTLLTQRELDPVEQVGLDVTLERLGLGRKISAEPMKAWLRKHGYKTSRYDLVPWSLIEEYLEGDVRSELKLWDHQRARVAAGEIEPERLERALDLCRTLYKMEARGLAYDRAQSLKAAEVLLRRAAEIEERMPFACTINEAKRWFFEGRRLEADRYTGKGAPSLDEEQVRAWVEAYELQPGEDSPYRWAPEYDEVMKLRRAVSMWYAGYPEKAGPDGRLRMHYKQAHVKSGRMAAQRVQLQAIPKADKALEGVPMVRELIRAEAGFGLWNLDLQQAELRVAAKYARCEKVLRMLAEGVDFHGETTKGVIGVQPDDPLWKEKRDIAKRLNFGAIFQIGGEKFQATMSKLANIHLPIEECDAYVRQWRRTYPEFGMAYYKAMRLFEHRGYVHLLPHTPYQVRSFMGPLDYPNTAWNRVVQGSLAEFLKLWLVEVERLWPGFMVLTIHDSIVVEAPLGEGDALAAAIAAHTTEMASELFRVPMPVDVSVWYRYDRVASENDQYGPRGRRNSQWRGLIAIDPGEKHVGVVYDPCYGGKHQIATMTMSPDELLEWLGMTLQLTQRFEVVVESFKLYPNQTRKTTYRRMGTSELIGAIKLLCRQLETPVVEQDATVKLPTRRQLRARGIRQIGRGVHQRDAELHYWYRRLRENGQAAEA